ncbi:proline-rich protein 2-like [Capsicum annuum]|uniref:proline-rich protein 2-like n=1 Tax=Capsicum annuum TaxID=4072 RepID=UPI001FB0954A|nr:proline-rich protein 2-like [Capsicum annuum]
MNGAVEAANKNIKKILRKMIENDRSWHEILPYALRGYRTIVRTSTEATSYLLMYGNEFSIPIKVEIPSLRIIQEAGLSNEEWVLFNLIRPSAPIRPLAPTSGPISEPRRRSPARSPSPLRRPSAPTRPDLRARPPARSLSLSLPSLPPSRTGTWSPTPSPTFGADPTRPLTPTSGPQRRPGRRPRPPTRPPALTADPTAGPDRRPDRRAPHPPPLPVLSVPPPPRGSASQLPPGLQPPPAAPSQAVAAPSVIR